jgi:hypothetical protein
MSEKVVWQMLQQYATDAGVPGIAPHDARRYAESRIMPSARTLATIYKVAAGNDSA